MRDAFCLWCKHFTSRSLVSQSDVQVTSDEKNLSQNTPKTLLKPVLKSKYKQISFFTLLTFDGESYLYNIS